jgi:hypothetical protein
VGLQYWTYNIAKKYVNMCYINKLFSCAMWEYNHNISRMKPNENISKPFVHCVLEVWFTLYPTKPFDVPNKNNISYSIMVMLYAELELNNKWLTGEHCSPG